VTKMRFIRFSLTFVEPAGLPRSCGLRRTGQPYSHFASRKNKK
jgi:hypothetical protein